jgi:hypothetical protein
VRAAHVLNHWTEPRYPCSLTGSAEASLSGLGAAAATGMLRAVFLILGCLQSGYLLKRQVRIVIGRAQL